MCIYSMNPSAVGIEWVVVKWSVERSLMAGDGGSWQDIDGANWWLQIKFALVRWVKFLIKYEQGHFLLDFATKFNLLSRTWRKR